MRLKEISLFILEQRVFVIDLLFIDMREYFLNNGKNNRWLLLIRDLLHIENLDLVNRLIKVVNGRLRFVM